MKATFKILKLFLAIFAVAITFAAIGLNAYEGAFAIAMTAPLILAHYETSSDAKQKRAEIWETMEGMVQKRKEEKRDWTDEENTRYDNLRSNFDKLTKHIETLEADEKRALIMAEKSLKKQRANQRGAVVKSLELFDHNTKEPIPVVKREDRFADIHINEKDICLAKTLRGYITGDWEGSETEKRALATTSNNSLLIPMSVFGETVDMARAKSVAVQAGARLYNMEAGNMVLARLTEIDGFQTKTENDKFFGGSATFEPIVMRPKTIGTFLRMSRELAFDAANIFQVLTRSLAAGVADYMDKLIFAGTGEGENLGLLYDESVNEIQTGGVLSYAHILKAWSLCKSANADDLISVVSTPEVYAMLQNLYESNSGFVMSPELLRSLTWYATSNLPSNMGVSENKTAVILGDFTKMLIGIRENAEIEISKDANDTFERHQLLLKVTMRVGSFAIYPHHFCRITGILPEENWWSDADYPTIGVPSLEGDDDDTDTDADTDET